MPKPKRTRGPTPTGPELPKLPDGTIDKDTVKQLYLASTHVEWSPFVRDQGWAVNTTYQHFPVKAWTEEKKRILAERQAEELAGQLFGFKSNWHKGVLSAMKHCPAAANTMLALVRHRQKQWVEMIDRDAQALKVYQETCKATPGVTHTPPASEFMEKVDEAAILRLSAATKNANQSIHESLLLNRWSVKEAENFSTPQGALEESDAASAREDRDWTIEIIGGEKITKAEMEAMMQRYLDPPQPKDIVVPPEPVTPQEPTDAKA